MRITKIGVLIVALIIPLAVGGLVAALSAEKRQTMEASVSLLCHLLLDLTNLHLMKIPHT